MNNEMISNEEMKSKMMDFGFELRAGIVAVHLVCLFLHAVFVMIEALAQLQFHTHRIDTFDVDF